MPTPLLRTARLSARIALLAAIYIVVARWGLRLDPVSRFATLVWVPTGLSLAALLLFGRDLWPGIALGALLVNTWNGAPIPVALGIAVGNTLEALLGEYALRRFPGFRLGLDRVADVLSFVAFAALASTAVSATIGVTSLYAGGLMPGTRFGETWFAWWLGDVIGDLVIAAFLLTWGSATWIRMTPRRVAEAVALGAVLFGGSLLLFGEGGGQTGTWLVAFQQPATLLPLLIWAALRFGTPGATGATLLISAVAIWSTILGRGPFLRPELHQSLATLQAFMTVVAVTFLVLAAVTAERRRVDRERNDLFHRERLARAYAEEIKRLRVS